MIILRKLFGTVDKDSAFWEQKIKEHEEKLKTLTDEKAKENVKRRLNIFRGKLQYTLEDEAKNGNQESARKAEEGRRRGQTAGGGKHGSTSSGASSWEQKWKQAWEDVYEKAKAEATKKNAEENINNFRRSASNAEQAAKDAEEYIRKNKRAAKWVGGAAVGAGAAYGGYKAYKRYKQPKDTTKKSTEKTFAYAGGLVKKIVSDKEIGRRIAEEVGKSTEYTKKHPMSSKVFLRPLKSTKTSWFSKKEK